MQRPWNHDSHPAIGADGFYHSAVQAILHQRVRRVSCRSNHFGGNLGLMALLLVVAGNVHAQVNSGSDGHDGAFNPTTNTVVNMADHPDGIYHYTDVRIPKDVLVSFVPNANNSPVVWLVQSNCTIDYEGVVDLSGEFALSDAGGLGGPGGFRGGKRGTKDNPPTPGQGPGGGLASLTNCYGGNASYGRLGTRNTNCSSLQPYPAQVYGNTCLIPLIGGSGGGGCFHQYSIPDLREGGGGGGGGAMMIAASGFIEVNGSIQSRGGSTQRGIGGGGRGSGGAIRLAATAVIGHGTLDTSGGGRNEDRGDAGGHGRVRIDSLDNRFVGTVIGESSFGFQPIIIPTAGQSAQLTVLSIGGVPVSSSPTGQLATPDAVLAAPQANPVPIVVRCLNIPLNTPITVSAKPMNGSPVSAVGYNNTGTFADSTATVSMNMPRGGGLIYATAATGN